VAKNPAQPAFIAGFVPALLLGLFSAAPAVALPRTFTSNQNGYTMEYPADWLPTPATTAWLPGTETRWGDPALDVLQSPAARVVAASQPLADGQTPDQWYQAYCRLGAPKPDCAAYATTWKQVGVGPSKGYLDIDGQPALPGSIKVGAPMYDAVIVVNGRGYEFTLDGDAPRAVFDQLLATVRFIPATGVSTQPLTDTFTSIIYGYSIKHGASWEITPATLPSDDPASNDNGSDRIQPTGTDTTVQIWVDSLGSQTFEAWKQQLGHDIANDVAIPESCRPSDPTAWPSIPVGDKTGFRIIKCNQQQVIVDAGDRVYSFLWGHDTFTTSEHLPLPIFDQMLTSVTFPKQPPHLPGPGMPASSPAVSPRS